MSSQGVKWFQFHVNPEPWAIGPLVVGRRGGRPTANIGRNQQLAAYKEAIKDEFEEKYAPIPAMWHPYYSLDFFFYRQQATYISPRERATRKHEADLTNLQKATEDALQGCLFENDRDVIRACSWMVEQGPDVKHPGVVVRFRWGVPRNELLTLLPVHLYDELKEYRHLQAVPNPAVDNSWPPKEIS